MSSNSPFDRPEVLSRRGGPVKEPLSRERVVATALALLVQEGLDGMSLRKVAVALETGPASLYPYVGDLDGLQALVLDRALAAVDVSGGRRRGWRERLGAVLMSYATVLIETPGLAQLAMPAPAIGPHMMRILDTLLGLLAEGGLARSTAAWTVDLLLLYATAIAVEQSRGHEPLAPDSAFAQALGAVSATAYPHVHAARDQLLRGEGPERFSWAIDVMVSGVLQCPVPGTRSGGRSKAPR
ncbi:MAG TPA: TetR/AcrR family transcriptional regulator [Polyangia bacterium]|nr:TetR/AcrR family transcriptional regulator [Polyangia bacterium]